MCQQRRRLSQVSQVQLQRKLDDAVAEVTRLRVDKEMAIKAAAFNADRRRGVLWLLSAGLPGRPPWVRLPHERSKQQHAPAVS